MRTGGCGLFLALLWPPEKRANRAGNGERAIDQRLDAIGDRHIDAARPRQLGQRRGGEGALSEFAGLRLAAASALAEREAEREVARLRRRAGEHEIAQARKAHQRLAPGAESLAEAAQFGESPRDQSRD